MAKKTIFWPGWLIDNPLTENPNDFTFSVKSASMLTTEDIARQLIAESTEFKIETLIDILNRGDRITVNNPSLLQFRIPALTAGDYWLEITTQFSKGNEFTKEPRTLRFDKVLNVPAAEPAP